MSTVPDEVDPNPVLAAALEGRDPADPVGSVTRLLRTRLAVIRLRTAELLDVDPGTWQHPNDLEWDHIGHPAGPKYFNRPPADLAPHARQSWDLLRLEHHQVWDAAQAVREIVALNAAAVVVENAEQDDAGRS